MFTRTALVLCLALFLLPATGTEVGKEGERHCASIDVVVRAAARDDAADICAGARAAIRFFESLQLRTDTPITVDVVETMPPGVGASAAGCFLEAQSRAVVLSFERFMDRKTWFELQVDRRLYQSVATHEVAHALAACNFRVAKPSIQAKEYVAYVAMFATMSEAHRRSALAALAGEGFEDDTKISTVIYLFDPMRFGVEAYRHYLKPENGRAFLLAVLNGKALVE